MFIGHYAPAFAAAAVMAKGDETTGRKAVGLGTLFVAGQLVDFGFFAFVLTGIERMRITPGITAMNPMDLYYMPYTHSLLGTVVWAVAFAALVYLITRNRTGALATAMVVLAHWLFDWLVHRPDMTLLGTPPKLGLGLWNYPWIEMPLELALIGGSLIWYMRRTQPAPGTKQLPVFILIGLLGLVQIIHWFGAEPETYDPSIPITGLVAFTVLALAAWWAGRARVAA